MPSTDATTTMSADQPSLARLLIDCLSTNSFAIVFSTASATAATHSQNTDPPASAWPISVAATTSGDSLSLARFSATTSAQTATSTSSSSSSLGTFQDSPW